MASWQAWKYGRAFRLLAVVELEGGPAEVVGARLRDDRDRGAAGVALFGLEAGSVDAHRIDRLAGDTDTT